MATKRQSPRSRRVAWPEPDNPHGGEFRLTWGRIAGILTVLVSLVAAVPTFWTLSDHWMNRAEIQQALKTHADHDASTQQWNLYGFAANRLEYLDDKEAECEAKKMVKAKLPPDDAAMCARYDAKFKAKEVEAADLKTKALDSTKEK